MKSPVCVCGAVLALGPAVGTAGADGPVPGAPVVVVYHLRAGSTDQEGCFPPGIGSGTCSCPVRGPYALRGAFTLAVHAPSPGAMSYTVPTAHFRVPAIGRTFDGGGKYQASNAAPPSGRMDLNMTFDNTGDVLGWSSGASGVQASPVIQATLTSPPACFNMLLTIRATPLVSDWNADGAVTVGDIFAFLNGWFSGDGDADEDGVTSVQDLFTFLSAWLSGV